MIIYCPQSYPYIYISLVQSIKLIEIYNINMGIVFFHKILGVDNLINLYTFLKEIYNIHVCIQATQLSTKFL